MKRALARMIAAVALVLVVGAVLFVRLRGEAPKAPELPHPVFASLRGHPPAPRELPPAEVLRFHDAMWEAISEYLGRSSKGDEDEEAREELVARVKKAKETVLTEATRHYEGSERYREGWREQLDEEEDKVWDKADLMGVHDQGAKDSR
ncbi:MAG: hypothetical protein ABFE16_13725 [Armatimonadia bacterium]